MFGIAKNILKSASRFWMTNLTRNLILSEKKCKEVCKIPIFGQIFRKMVPHKNVSRTLGVCYQPLALLTELAETDLKNFQTKSSWWKTASHMVQIATEITEGMIHLHVELWLTNHAFYTEFPHLALRFSSEKYFGVQNGKGISIQNRRLWSQSNFIRQPKSNDFFAFSRYNHREPSLTTLVAWTSPETMKTHTFAKPNDVWSFGVLLWEISTGMEPYSDSNLSAYQLREVICQKGCLLKKDQL